ncbi:hypothetical protein [Rhizohabitans arisaemae]|uniref:hypothetical protein n=1 Tax=Rhizohabitans arisaemae TaxID=2720610 RepID=UPI0024B16161|nr:hypothetical protein [Rhizohabitans arisaemae]
MIESVERDGRTLRGFAGEYRRLFAGYEVATGALTELDRIGGWAEDQLPSLRRRHTLSLAAARIGDTPFTAVTEKILTLGEAREHGRALGLVHNQIFREFSGDFQAEAIHRWSEKIAGLAKDPDAAAAFYTALDPQIRDVLPALIADSGSRTAKGDLERLGRALGAALRSGSRPPGFDRVKQDFLRPTNRVTAWNRLALLRSAGAPTAFRSEAARALALDGFARAPRGDQRGAGRAQLRAFGYPGDTVALAFDVLAGDGAAVRDAFAKMGGPSSRLGRIEKMKLVLDHAGRPGNERLAESFGRAAESGAEAGTERPGKHSREAAAFTFDLIRVASGFRENLPAGARPSMARIGASYVHELVSGGRFDKAALRESGMTRPPHWEDAPGVTPAFFLSPKDTYGFLRTFAGDERLTEEFDESLGSFRQEALMAAARRDAQQGGLTKQFRGANIMFGDFGGLQFLAEVEVRGQQDATEALVRNFLKNTAGLGLEIGFKHPAAQVAWTLTKAYGASAVLDDWAGDFEKRVEKVTEARVAWSVRMKYDLAQILHQAGFPATPPPAELVDKRTGGLKSYDQFVAEAKVDASTGTRSWDQVLLSKLAPYEEWLDANEIFDEKVESGSRLRTSDYAKNLIRKSS